MRLFLALRLPDDVLDVLVAWQAAHLRGVRVLPREHLHVTLAFLGHRPARELEPIVGALRTAAAGAPADLRLTVRRYRETRSVAMIVLEDSGGGATALAEGVQSRLEQLGVYRREGRPWLPHVTVGRFRAGEPPRLRLDPPTLPAEFGGTFVPSDAAAYLSRLHPGGARYDVLETVALGG